MKDIRRRRFRSELDMLADQLRDALVKGEMRRTRVGFQSLRNLIAEVPRYSQRLFQKHSLLAPITSESYGEEWQDLLRSVWSIQQTGMQIQHAQVRNRLLVFLFELVINAVRLHAVAAVRDLSSLIAETWRDINDPSSNWTVSTDGEYYLLRLREVSYLWIREANDSDVEDLLLMLARMYATTAKNSIDSNDAEATKKIVDIFGDVGDRRSKTTPYENFIRYRDATLLALDAWSIFKRAQAREGGDDDAPIHRLLRDKLDHDHLWEASLTVHQARFEEGIGWGWWELPPTHGRFVSGFAQFSTYVDAATLLAASYGGMHVPETENDESANLARRLLELSKQAESGQLPWLNGLLPEGTGIGSFVESNLKERIQAQEIRTAEALANSPIDPEKVLSFCVTLIEGYQSRTRLMSQVSEVHRTELNEATFGVNHLEDKRWYVASRDGGFDSAEHGRSTGEALAAAEEEILTETLTSDSVSHASSKLNEIRQSVADWFNQAATGEKIVVTNSWLAMRALARVVSDTEPADDHSGDLTTDGGARIFRVYDSGESFVAGFVTPDGIEVVRGSVKPSRDGDTTIAEGRFLVGVSELNDDDLTSLRTRNPDTSDLMLRQNVVVRVLERVRVIMNDAANASIWYISDADY